MYDLRGTALLGNLHFELRDYEIFMPSKNIANDNPRLLES
jgi:hypothetical protein